MPGYDRGDLDETGTAMNFNNLSLWGVIVLIADIYAVINILGSSAEPLKKALWIVLILLLPVIGFVIWLLLGPKSARR